MIRRLRPSWSLRPGEVDAKKGVHERSYPPSSRKVNGEAPENQPGLSAPLWLREQKR